MPSKQPRKYDDAFKGESVQLYLSSGKSYLQLSQDLNIPSSTLVGWVRSGKYHTVVSQLSSVEVEATKVLRKELTTVMRERDILKKALAIFSTDGTK